MDSILFCIVDSASQTDSDEFSGLITTNSLLAKELIEKNNLIASKDEKYIAVLEDNFKRQLACSNLKEKIKQIELENMGLKQKIQDLNEKNFCNDLIQFDGMWVVGSR